MKRVTVVIAAGVVMLLLTSAALAADITFTRSMETRQLDPFTYVLTCTLEYSGVNANHTHIANLFADVPGIGTTYPLGGEVGPEGRVLVIHDPGVTRFKAVLRGNRLSMERIVHFTVPVPEDVTPGASLHCQGGAGDNVASIAYPVSQMSDVFFGQWLLCRSFSDPATPMPCATLTQ